MIILQNIAGLETLVKCPEGFRIRLLAIIYGFTAAVNSDIGYGLNYQDLPLIQHLESCRIDAGTYSAAIGFGQNNVFQNDLATSGTIDPITGVVATVAAPVIVGTVITAPLPFTWFERDLIVTISSTATAGSATLLYERLLRRR